VAENLQKQGLLSNRDELDELDRTFLTQVMNRTLPADEWPETLYKLTGILRTIHKRDVIVLIDEYDTPAAHASENGYFSEVCLDQPSLMSILVDLLKANDFFRDVFQPLLKVSVFRLHASLPI
jgi:hypothetical protein